MIWFPRIRFHRDALQFAIRIAPQRISIHKWADIHREKQVLYLNTMARTNGWFKRLLCKLLIRPNKDLVRRERLKEKYDIKPSYIERHKL